MWFPMGGGGGGGDQGEEQKPTPRPPPMVTTTGYWYSDHHHQIPQPPAEICGSYSNPGMEMVGWKSFLNKAAGAPSSSSSSKAAAGLSGDFNAHHHHHHHQDFCSAWVDHGDNDSSSSLRCVFPCEGNERPSHGLSLSLSSANPSAIGLQPFELRAAANPVAGMNHGFFSGKPVANHLEINNTNSNNCGYYEMRESKYLGAAQELLNEFCSLGTSESSGHNNSNNGSRIKKKMACNQWQEGDESTTHNAAGTTSACNRNPCLDSLDLLELHNTQTKLLHMLQEVDRRYKQYCDEMKAVVSSFEAVAGDGAGKGYAASAAKAMSRHFRCLRDGIVAQLKEVKKAAAEKDHTAAAPEAAAGGTTKGETPRLKVLDQALRQQKALQQMSMMEAHPWRPQRGLPERSVSVLRAWLFEHFLHPYPSDVDKHILARQTGLSRSQVSNWFINARVRLWKPMVEEMYQEETKEQEYPLIANSSSDDANAQAGGRRLDHRNPRTASDAEDHKPNNLVRVDISSILNNNNNNNQSGANVNDELDRWPIFGAARGGGDHRSFAPAGLADGDVGFPSLPHPAWAHGNPGGSFGYGARAGGGGGGVSLTLGLQQQGGSGMGLAAAFSASTAASSSSAGPPPSLFYARSDQMEDCQTVPYPLLDSEGQNLPYRNLTGAQLLHDLAGQ